MLFLNFKNYNPLLDLTHPSIPKTPKPSEIKPPAHWLIPQEKKKSTETVTDTKREVYEDLKQLFSNSNPGSSVVINFYFLHTLAKLCNGLVALLFYLLPNYLSILSLFFFSNFPFSILECMFFKPLDVRSNAGLHTFRTMESDMEHGHDNECAREFTLCF